MKSPNYFVCLSSTVCHRVVISASLDALFIHNHVTNLSPVDLINNKDGTFPVFCCHCSKWDYNDHKQWHFLILAFDMSSLCCFQLNIGLKFLWIITVCFHIHFTHSLNISANRFVSYFGFPSKMFLIVFFPHSSAEADVCANLNYKHENTPLIYRRAVKPVAPLGT